MRMGQTHAPVPIVVLGQRREDQRDDGDVEEASGQGEQHGETRETVTRELSKTGANPFRRASFRSMALFFDQAWYDERLAERGLSRAVLAAVAGMSGEELALAYKDQSELTAAQVAAFAEVLGVPLAEAARRAGVGAHAMAPASVGQSLEQRVASLEARVAALEAELARLKA